MSYVVEKGTITAVNGMRHHFMNGDMIEVVLDGTTTTTIATRALFTENYRPAFPPCIGDTVAIGWGYEHCTVRILNRATPEGEGENVLVLGAKTPLAENPDADLDQLEATLKDEDLFAQIKDLMRALSDKE